MFLLLTHMACPTLFKCFVNENFDDDDDDDGNSKVTEIVNMLQQPVPRKYTTMRPERYAGWLKTSASAWNY